VPPQSVLPTNPDTTDGIWYSEVLDTDVIKEVYPTHAFINAVPNPVGVNQEVLLHLGITQQLSLDGMHWYGITVEVTRPDNTTEVLGGTDGFTTDSTGGTGTVYVPSMTGNYTFQTHFPEQQTIPGNTAGSSFGAMAVPVGAHMGESYSRVLTVVVNTDPITFYPGFALPTEYWTRPIDAQIREWSAVAGSSFEPEYQDAPESAHVLWAKRLGVEGTLGGTVDTRENYTDRIILAGILLYSTDTFADATQTLSASQTRQTVAVDVRTGEELWRADDMEISWGHIYYHDSINRHAAYAYAWTLDEATRTAISYDPFTGYRMYTINNFPEGPVSIGPIGEMMSYIVNFTGRYMYTWNQSWQYMEGQLGMSQAWNQLRATRNALPLFGYRAGWQDNITLPAGLTGEIRDIIWGDRVIGVDIQGGVSREWAFSLKPDEQGDLLYDRSVNYALPNVATVEGPMYLNGSIADHVQLRYSEATGKYWAFSLNTGDTLWKSDDFEATANGETGGDRDAKLAYGMLYTAGPSGMVYGYDVHKGLNWTYSAWDNPSEMVDDSLYWSGIALVSDGKVYVAFGEPAQGASFVCLDAFTGDEVWRVDGMFRQTWGGPNVFIGDSVIVTLDTYDQRVYAIGKGPTDITASAPDITVPFDTPVMVTGRVTDVSPGTFDSGLGTYRNVDVTIPTWESVMKLRFPDGVPAVSDESQGEWMKYVYKNLPRPADVVGVEVVVSVLDSNDNYYEVGRTTADGNGAFMCEFTPLIPGDYVVYAAFEGSDSYYGSVAKAFISVADEIPAPPPPTPTPESVADAYFVPAIAGIIVAIVVIGALLALIILRKR